MVSYWLLEAGCRCASKEYGNDVFHSARLTSAPPVKTHSLIGSRDDVMAVSLGQSGLRVMLICSWCFSKAARVDAKRFHMRLGLSCRG
jgi:hypothetical protein